MSPQAPDLEFLKDLFNKKGFEHHGWTSLETPVSIAYYKSWLDKGYSAGMEYLKRHLEQKENPQKLLQKAKTAFIFARNYFPTRDDHFPLKQLKVSLYARQNDYHFWFQDELNSLALELKSLFPEHEFVAFTDSKPVLERGLAKKAGLGWIGKNACLINEKKGSLFFIGEIYTTLKITNQVDLAADRCGTCTRCIDICPTGAIVEPRIVDANKCISYLTIEAKDNPPEELRSKLSGWYYGCDLCQVVCPWNQKIYKEELKVETQKYDLEKNREELVSEIKDILHKDRLGLKEQFKDSPLNRAKPWAHKRNAILVACEYKLSEILEDLEFLQSDKDTDPRLKELIFWAMKEISNHCKTKV